MWEIPAFCYPSRLSQSIEWKKQLYDIPIFLSVFIIMKKIFFLEIFSALWERYPVPRFTLKNALKIVLVSKPGWSHFLRDNFLAAWLRLNHSRVGWELASGACLAKIAWNWGWHGLGYIVDALSVSFLFPHSTTDDSVFSYPVTWF